MPIAYTDPQSGRTLVARLAPQFEAVLDNPEFDSAITRIVEQILHLTPGAWRKITEEEATELQPSTPEKLTEARKAEIHARLNEIDRLSARPNRAIAKALAQGLAPPQIDIERLTALEAEAEGLRGELAGLAG